MAASDNPYLRFGTGSDPVANAALVLALIALIVAVSPRSLALVSAWLPVRRRLALLGLLALLLSAGYVHYYLRGGPRIVDAAHYYLEGRALAHGYFDFPVPTPTASFNGRFLVEAKAGGSLGALFPPGYPLALALAWKLGQPMWLGPLLALALVWLTYELALELGQGSALALTAAGLSLVCAALRYHTADTMSHGFSAVLVALALVAALRATPVSVAVSGLATGWLVATRPVTGAVVGACLAIFLLLERRNGRSLLVFLAAALPGVGLLLAYQHALTGAWLGSTQLEYYARADGPPGCFRYGFGAGIGCLFEHGDYVRARLPHGYGLREALATTLRRVLVHGVDVANCAPLALAIPLGAWRGWREPRVRLLVALSAAIVLAYAPFYFEGSYPGGGARFFADALPLEHVLLALGLSKLGMARFAWPAALAGFALHAGRQHLSLRDRDGGRPAFEASVLRASGVSRGLVFVNDDEAFALGYDPSVAAAKDGVLVARSRTEPLDHLLWERQGRPPTFRYAFETQSGQARPHLVAFRPEPGAARRVEAEALWPVAAARNGWVHPVDASSTCASGRRLMRVESATRAEVDVRLPRWPSGPRQLRLGWFGAKSAVELRWADQTTHELIPVRWVDAGGGCWRSEPVELPLPGPALEPKLTVIASPGVWDYVEWVGKVAGAAGEDADKGVDN